MASEESIVVDVPIRTAYNQWTQFEDFPRFMSGVEKITQIDDVRNHWVTNIGGVRREFDTRITEQIPDERVAWTTESGSPKQSGVVTFHRLEENRTKVMVQLDINSDNIVEKVGEKLGVVDKQVQADLAKYKEWIESRGTETGGWRGGVDRPTP
ncbi:Polyketide cyclase / dehydrase and lipid transport [Actinopolymorpha cephalotaxi]|uniref:Membrane protein n=1 Tax=Actinopolymorpha cephalotaxi TaxID=504797 RepID=A0A1I2NA56_9ACTN|nr:SRPBCC family protein [Actinopolymorpha cephalotaxi]NYH85610.1 putative membrane protein [Actinopolymorpha cephalotaxi]SFG00805.1 Polyketide cyclase / dehydrase and lipid transport [Actinopolymorpha cephalotaxi]